MRSIRVVDADCGKTKHVILRATYLSKGRDLVLLLLLLFLSIFVPVAVSCVREAHHLLLLCMGKNCGAHECSGKIFTGRVLSGKAGRGKRTNFVVIIKTEIRHPEA